MSEDESTPTEDDIKRKFREALERKNAGKQGAAGGGPDASGKVHGAHASESHQKSFRRKSGG